MKLDETIAAGDRVVSRMTWSGIRGGAFRGIPATGKRVAWSAISIIRVTDGQIAEAWVNEDDLGLLLRIGATVQPAHR